MYITLRTLKDALQEYRPVGVISEDPVHIYQVSLSEYDSNNTDSHCLSISLSYNTEFGEIEEDVSHIPTPHVSCIMNGDYLVLATDNLQTVLNKTLQTLSYYHEWYNRLMQAIYQSAPFFEIANILNAPFNGIVNILDEAGDVLVVTSDDFNGKREWKKMASSGKITPYYLYQQNDPECLEVIRGKDVIKLINKEDQNATFLLAKIDLPNDAFLLVFIHEYERHFSRGDIDLFRGACNIMQHLNPTIYPPLETSVKESFSSIIDGKEADYDRLMTTLFMYNITDDNPYSLLYVTSSETSGIIHSQLFNALNHVSDKIFSFKYKKGAVLLSNESSLPSFHNTLLKYLTLLDMTCGISLPFYHIQDLPEAFDQASLAIDQGGAETGTIYHCKDYVLNYCLQKTAATLSKHHLIHPAVLKLARYDQENNTHLLSTLHTFLLHQSSYSKTAEILYIHKNSLRNRIDRIKEIADLDFSDYKESLYILLCLELYENNYLS